jgi:hypothetical protein
MNAQQNGGFLDALKVSFKPFKLDITTESGEPITLWSLPMRFDFFEEKKQRQAIEERLKSAEGIEDADRENLVHMEMLCVYLKDRLVQPPADSAKGFSSGEAPQPLFESADQVPAYLSYNAMMKTRLAIQASGLKLAPEQAVKN